MNERQYLQHRLHNALHTVLLLGAMAGLLGLLGWVLMGTTGLVLLVVLGMLFLTMTPHLTAALTMQLVGAQRLHPEELPVVHNMLAQLTRRAGLPKLPKLYLLPSHEINAFSVGDRKDAAVAVSSGLLRRLDCRELNSVLAHEISHIDHADTRILSMAALAGRLTRSLAMFGLIMLLIYLPLYLIQGEGVPLLLIAILLAAPLAGTWLQLALSRTREFAADMKAAALTGDPRGLASALNTLERNQRNNLFARLFPTTGPGNEPQWLRSHPETSERIRRLLEVEHARPEHLHSAILIH